MNRVIESQKPKIFRNDYSFERIDETVKTFDLACVIYESDELPVAYAVGDSTMVVLCTEENIRFDSLLADITTIIFGDLHREIVSARSPLSTVATKIQSKYSESKHLARDIISDIANFIAHETAVCDIINSRRNPNE